MSFTDDIARHTAKTLAKEKALFINIASAVKGSIVDGSTITGAPGQPVGQYGVGYHPGKVGGTLKASWVLAFETDVAATISTNVIYAPVIEDNIRNARLRSTVGGFHSVKYTLAGFERVVEAEARKVAND